ncbi:MAG: transcriptional regulator [Planctomycetota bacterium]|nr:MAG: transcriptional regulator [Planctomycetota bacterium]
MKQVIAVIRPFLAEKVLESLRLAPIEACSVREVKGYGRQKSYLDQYGESEYSMAFLPKVEISLWVDDTRVDEVVRQIVEVARTGRMGDGKIFVLAAQESASVIHIGADAASQSSAAKVVAKTAADKKPTRRKAAR